MSTETNTPSISPEALPAHDVTIDAKSSTSNHTDSDQDNVMSSTSVADSSPETLAPFNDAPIDLLSIHFTGRKTELDLISKALERRGDIPRRCALYGNQGVGKSQLTYAWTNSTFDRKENAYIFWISALTVEKLHQGFCRLLNLINHPDRSDPDLNIRLAAARRWLEQVDTGNWLLVLDNVSPEVLDFLQQQLPRNNGRGTILFTTRVERVASAVAATAGECHEVPLLTVKEGVELFLRHFNLGKIDPESPNIAAIVEAVGCLPLAISHAASYVKKPKCTPDDMREVNQSVHKIDLSSWENTHSEYERKSVVAIFMYQLEDLERQSPVASNFLRLLAFFDPDSISLEMLTASAIALNETQRPLPPTSTSLIDLLRSRAALRNATTQLQSRCLVAYHSGSQSPTFRLHDLIRLVVSENTRRHSFNQELFELAVQLVGIGFMKLELFWTPEWWPQSELLMPHIQSLVMRQDISSSVASDIKKLLLGVNYFRGAYLERRGHYVEAESVYQDTLVNQDQLFGPDEPASGSVIGSLALLYLRTDRCADAETMLNRMLETYNTRYGPEHRHSLDTMCLLGHTYFNQGRYDDAEELLTSTLHSQERQLGSDDQDTLWTVRILAMVYYSQQRFDEADSLVSRVLQAQKRELDSRHTLFRKQVDSSERHEDTVTLLLQSVANEKEIETPIPISFEMMYAVAVAHDSQGRYIEAEKVLLHAAAGLDDLLGFSHPLSQHASNLLASVYKKLDRHDDANAIEQRISLLH